MSQNITNHLIHPYCLSTAQMELTKKVTMDNYKEVHLLQVQVHFKLQVNICSRNILKCLCIEKWQELLSDNSETVNTKCQ